MIKGKRRKWQRILLFRNDCEHFKQGDIFVRKGTCNLRATRKDLDIMYNGRQNRSVEIYNDSLFEQELYITE